MRGSRFNYSEKLKNETEVDAAAKSDWQRLLALARPEATMLLAGTLALLIGTGTALAGPALVGYLVDGVTEGSGRAGIDRAALWLLLVFALGGLATALRSYWFTVAGERVVARLRDQLYAAVIHREIAFFDERRTGELTNRLSSDTTVLQNAVTVNLSMALRYALQALGAIVILMWTSWQLTFVMLAVVPVVVIAAAVYGRLIRKVSRKVQDALAQASEVAEETIAGVRTVRAFAREEAEIKRYETRVLESFHLAKYRALLGSLFSGGVSFAGYGAIAAVLWYGGILLSEGTLSFGTLTSFLLYTFMVAFSIGALSGLWSDFARAAGASSRVFKLLDERVAMQTEPGRKPAATKGEVRFDNVDFSYPSRAETLVLRNLSFFLEPGEAVALVGPSGSGKSTVAALLSRLYEPQSGTLFLDGDAFHELDASWLRRQVGVVSQEPILFATSIKENIRYGREEANAEEIEAAARAANAHGFISDFADGYETTVGERGVRLSGGQKQRVAIARALIKDPKILILDEATSALDANTEHLVKEALERLMVGRTTLIIAHRLSTVQQADRVMVLDHGALVEQGRHQDLIEQNGLYRRLVEHQFIKESE